MKHGTYWIVAPGQDTDGAYVGYGEEQADETYTMLLKTIEAPDDLKFSETDERFESVRYFEEK